MNERGCPPDYNGGFCADYNVDCDACWEQWEQEHKTEEGRVIMETIKKYKPIECPNCGAPLRSENCEYCGSHIDLGTNLQIELEIARLRKKIAYEQCQLAQASQSNQLSALYANNDPYSYI